MPPSGAGLAGRQNLGPENCLGLAGRAFWSANFTGFETATLEAPDNDHNRRRIYTIDGSIACPYPPNRLPDLTRMAPG
jgi:hypothetical protein